MDTQKERAQKLFSLLCRDLDDNEWEYEQDKEQPFTLNSYIGFESDESFFYTAALGADTQYAYFRGIFPFTVPKPRRITFAYAVATHNAHNASVTVDFDLQSGYVGLRKTAVLAGAIVGGGFFYHAMESYLFTAQVLYPRLLRIAQNDVSLADAHRIMCGEGDNG